MKTRHDLDGLLAVDEEHTVWEPSDQRPAHISMDDEEALWSSGDIRKARIDRAQEVRPETR
jgi:hypothetical protein